MTYLKRLHQTLRRKSAAEDGNATVEFVIVVPIFCLIFVSIFELGMAMTRLTMLEHGLDVTMRDIRLGTDDTFTHDEIRDRICESATVLKDCTDGLQVELVRIKNGDVWNLPARNATCIDQSPGAAEPVIAFNQGTANDVMFLRACFVVEPLYPTFGLGAILETDNAGNMHLVANSAFSQEPS